jgi:myo-inositol-1(or 4)-monophosphatase
MDENLSFEPLNMQYHGIAGQGSFLTHGDQSRRLPLSPPRPLRSLSEALIAVEWGSDRSLEVMRKKSESFVALAGNPVDIKDGKMAHSLRSVGSAALNFAMVASGRLDIYW